MRSFLSFALLAFAAVRCTGTETDNPASPLESFEGSKCVKSPPEGDPPRVQPDGGPQVGAVTQNLESSNVDDM